MRIDKLSRLIMYRTAKLEGTEDEHPLVTAFRVKMIQEGSISVDVQNVVLALLAQAIVEVGIDANTADPGDDSTGSAAASNRLMSAWAAKPARNKPLSGRKTVFMLTDTDILEKVKAHPNYVALTSDQQMQLIGIITILLPDYELPKDLQLFVDMVVSTCNSKMKEVDAAACSAAINAIFGKEPSSDASMSFLQALRIKLEEVVIQPPAIVSPPARETISQYVEMIVVKLRETLSYTIIEKIESVIRAVLSATLEKIADSESFDPEAVATAAKDALLSVSVQQGIVIAPVHSEIIYVIIKSALVDIKTIIESADSSHAAAMSLLGIEELKSAVDDMFSKIKRFDGMSSVFKKYETYSSSPFILLFDYCAKNGIVRKSEALAQTGDVQQIVKIVSDGTTNTLNELSEQVSIMYDEGSIEKEHQTELLRGIDLAESTYNRILSDFEAAAKKAASDV